jgi:hypothetical protein
MWRKRKSPIRVELVGGLGNQLFGIFAGAYLAQKLQVPLAYHFARKRSGETKHNSSLESLDLGLETIHEHHGVYISLLIARKIIRRTLETLGLSKSKSERLARLHTSVNLGSDPSLDDCEPGSIIQGYFQTYGYFESVYKNRTRLVKLRRESDWYNEASKRIIAERPVVIHVRRGDYALEKNSDIGVLSAKYFETAIEEIKSGRPEGKIRLWVFSDDIELVRKELSFLDGPLTTWVVQPINSDPAESMMLMSMASTLVISNSTFSWWAAAINREAEVIAPAKWFRRLEDPEGIMPTNWKLLDSQWID